MTMVVGLHGCFSEAWMSLSLDADRSMETMETMATVETLTTISFPWRHA